jgi:hypothetical protein
MEPENDFDDSPLPPSLAPDAGPYLRRIFAVINDPTVTGRGRTAEYFVPVRLRPFVTEYLDGKGYAIRFFSGQLTQKAYLTIAPKDEK